MELFCSQDRNTMNRNKKNNKNSKILSAVNTKSLLFVVLFALLTVLFYRNYLINKVSDASFAKNTHKDAISYYSDRRIPYFSPTPTNAPTPTPTPTVAPSTTVQTPLNGYCLTVPILMYHHVQPYSVASDLGQASLTVDNSMFDQQMAYLSSSGYTTLSADQLINALRTHSGVPSKSIVLTFDDGYKDNFDYAFPIIQKYGLTANIMVPTGLMENPGWVSWNDLRTMVNSGRFFAYDHTWSHASLAGVSDEKAMSEIVTSKTQLEQNLGRPVSVFAYPYGSENQRIINLLIQNGFVGAFSTIPGWTQCDSFIMTLHRNRVGNSQLSSYGL
jgi:peptidoglycan/xylan/chitin deacetylase (PgdA/CDA1 family)